MSELEFSLERTVVIRATRATVFRFFTDSERFAAWWGKGSSIDARPGGKVVIRYPDGTTASGSVVELAQGERIAFTYGYDAPGKPIAPGGSLVTIRLRDEAAGTLVELRHDVHEKATRDEHDPGWRFQLSLFAGVASAEQHADFPARLAGWFQAWRAPDVAASLTLLEQSTTPQVTFRDVFACVAGQAELAAHIHAARFHMPGIALDSEGKARACQGTVVAGWVATRADGTVAARGTNVFELAPDGRIASVVGLAE